MRTAQMLVLLAVVLVVAACGQLDSLTQMPIDPGVSVTADPAGDAGSAPTFDVLELRTVRGTSTLAVRLWTQPDPALPAPGTAASSSQFSGGIGFNTDLNSATGVSFVPPCGGGQGHERFIDLTTRNANGTYNVFDAAFFVVGTAAVTQDGPRATWTVSFSTLGTTTGRTQVNAVVGVGVFTGKDCVPDAGQALPTRERTTPARHPVIW